MDFIVSIPDIYRDVSAEDLRKGIADALKEFTGGVAQPVRPSVCWLLNHREVSVVRLK